MEENNRYVIILDYSSGEVIKIRLTDDQLKDSESYDDFELYLSTLEDIYGFKLRDCYWMSVKNYREKSFGL